MRVGGIVWFWDTTAPHKAILSPSPVPFYPGLAWLMWSPALLSPTHRTELPSAVSCQLGGSGVRAVQDLSPDSLAEHLVDRPATEVCLPWPASRPEEAVQAALEAMSFGSSSSRASGLCSFVLGCLALPGEHFSEASAQHGPSCAQYRVYTIDNPGWQAGNEQATNHLLYMCTKTRLKGVKTKVSHQHVKTQ